MFRVHFTVEEFNTMVNQLLYSNPASCDMLCQIAEKTLRAKVVYWCKAEDCLRGRQYEGDIMQNIFLKLMQTTVYGFLLRKDIDGPYNNNPEGFESWMFTVAENVKKDFANKVRNRDFKTEDLEGATEKPTDPYEDFDAEARIDMLNQSFSIILSANINIYKVLTWLAQSIIILDLDVTKIKANNLMISAFENKTLYEMYDMILVAAKRIPWLLISEEQNEKILASLQKKADGLVSYGEIKYKDFFMKQNGEVSGKKSISDWMNKMNKMIKQKLDPDSNADKKKE